MSWETILKKKKINMDHLRKIVEHLLDAMPDKEFALIDFNTMVTTTYKKYNPKHQGPRDFTSILAHMLNNRGYVKTRKSNPQITYYRKGD